MLTRWAVLISVMTAGTLFAVPSVSVELGPTRTLADLSAPCDWGDTEETLHFDADPDRGVSINGTYSYGGGVRFTATADLRVKAVLYYLTENADDIFVHVSGQGTNAQPGPQLDTTRATGQGGSIWRRANMPQQPLISAGQDFWTCVIVRRHPSGQHPLTLDLGPIVPWRGGFITLPSIGPDWYQLTDPPFWTDRNWDIRAVVEYETGVEEVIGAADQRLRHSVLPKPAQTRVVFSFSARARSPVQVTICDAVGQPVRKLNGGSADVVWDLTDDSGRRVPAGTYLYRLTAGSQSDTGCIPVIDWRRTKEHAHGREAQVRHCRDG